MRLVRILIDQFPSQASFYVIDVMRRGLEKWIKCGGRRMENQWCLSDLIEEVATEDGYFDVISTEDVQEFIKRLKEELFKRQIIVDGIIDKLAGDKLMFNNQKEVQNGTK